MMDFDIFDWMIIVSAAENFTDDGKEIKKIEKDYFDDESNENDDDF